MREMQQGFVYINAAIQDSITESTGDETWVTYGTPMLDVQADYLGPNGLRPKIQQTMKSLTDEISRLSEDKVAAVAAAAAAQPAAPNNSIASNASTVAARQADVDQQKKTRESTVTEFMENARNKIDYLGRNYSNQTDAEYRDNKALAAFLGNAYGNMSDPLTAPLISGSLKGYDDSGPQGLMDDIVMDDDVFSKFELDPIGFMKSYKLPNGTNWYDGWVERNQ